MSSINEKSIRVVAFSGDTKDYRMWSARFMAAAHVKKYNECLTEDFSKKAKVKKVDTEVATDLVGEVSTDLSDE